MLFSIVVPVYNVENYLSDCLESIIPQALNISDGCEIILVDDGSTDSSSTICDKFETKYSRIVKAFHKKNEGLLSTRRYGFSKACGDYIINCDSDDFLEPRMLAKLKNIIEKYNKPDVVIYNYNNAIGDQKKPAYRDIFTSENDLRITKYNVLEKFLTGYSVVSLCTKMFKRNCIDINKDYSRFYKISNGEDSLQSIEIFSNAKTFVYLNDELYDYRIGSGMTHKFDENYYYGFRDVLRQIREEKSYWKVNNFERMFAIKVMQTAGRAVTQSRYNLWKSYEEQKEYLATIREDEMVEAALPYIHSIKENLQIDHYYLMKLMKARLYFAICLSLHIKNILTKMKEKSDKQ